MVLQVLHFYISYFDFYKNLTVNILVFVNEILVFLRMKKCKEFYNYISLKKEILTISN